MALELSIQEAIVCHEGICQTVRQYEILKDRLDRSGEYLEQADKLRDTHRKSTNDPKTIRQQSPDTKTIMAADVGTELTEDEQLVRVICKETGAEPDLVRNLVARHKQRLKIAHPTQGE